MSPGIAPGPTRDAALVDIAPTVAALLGVALPAPDGHALPITRNAI